MRLLARIPYRDVTWSLLVGALVLSAAGLVFIASSTADVAEGVWFGAQARMQLVWWGLSLAVCLLCLHVPLETWRSLAIPAFIATLALQVLMLALRGTAFVPLKKGAYNWLVLGGGVQVQPSEFYKIATLLLLAKLLAEPSADARRLGFCLGCAAVAGFPALLIAGQDFGSALTFLPLIAGLLLLAGMRLRWLTAAAFAGALAVVVAVPYLPRDGHHWRRLCAWWDPESYQQHEGFQTLRALRSIGSGQLNGKGYAAGDQNLMGKLPEDHTDMIFGVIAEETGFIGSSLVVLGLTGYCLACLTSAMRCRVPYGRYLIAGLACLLMGQVTINLLVATGLMPVTGITLPFFSYGGSSLLVVHILVGIGLAASAARTRQLGRTRYSL